MTPRPPNTVIAAWPCILAALLAFAGPAFAQSEADPAPAEPDAESADTDEPERAPTADTADQQVQMPAGANVAVVPVQGMIYDFTLDSLKRRIERAMNQGASVIVIELDTNGGTVDAGMATAKYLRSLPVPTVAWINNKAYSAGILIASAADRIVMAPASATGDCAPIVPGQEMAPTERAKKLSPILEEFRDSAQTNNYDYALFHAMCVLGVEVYYIEHPDTGQRRLVNQVDYQLMVHGQSPDQQSTLSQWLNANQSDPDGEQTVGKPRRMVAAEDDLGQWQPVTTLPSGQSLPNGQLHDGQTLLTLSATRAKDVGLSEATIADRARLRQHLNAANVRTVRQTWSENLAGFLTSPMVRGILVIALLLGAYLEFQSPGLGIPGAIAALALLALLGAPFLVGLAEVWHLVVFVLGAALLLVEIAFVPSFGLLGIAGLFLMLVGLVMSVVPTGGGGGFGPIQTPAPAVYDQLVKSLASMLLGLIASLVGFFFITKYVGSIPLFNRLILADRPHGGVEAAAEAGQPGSAASVSGGEALGAGQIKPGDTGRVSVSGLRPAGRAEINDQIVDVVSVGPWIEANRKIRVIEARGNRIVVEERD